MSQMMIMGLGLVGLCCCSISISAGGAIMFSGGSSGSSGLGSLGGVLKTDCKSKNGNYVSKSASSWSDADRNTAIWLVNNISGTDVGELQGMSNDDVKLLVDGICK